MLSKNKIECIVIDIMYIVSILLVIGTMIYYSSNDADGMTITNTPPRIMLQWRPVITREAQFIYGINAPIPMFAGQIQQESGGRANITAGDGGMGLTQFMNGTVKQIVTLYPELGPANPYDGKWAIRAQVRFDDYLYLHVKGKNDCERFASALKGYNAGLGFVQRAQRKSPDPETWFTLTEYIEVGQSEKNMQYSREYSRWILFFHQPAYVSWGMPVCIPSYKPIDKFPQ